MRICLAYDCLFPYTVGGAERWLRALADRLVERGHEVTYLTARQWPAHEPPDVPGVRVVAVAPEAELYAGSRRRIGPILRFNAGLLAHLLRHGRRYDAVHVTGLQLAPLAAAAARARSGYRLVVLWFEAWTRSYWREYLGDAAGTLAWVVQRLSLRPRQHVLCFARVHADRVRAEGFSGPLTLVGGVYWERLVPAGPLPAEPLLVYAGRHIPEKRVPALVEAFPEARRRVDGLRCEIFGDGPSRAAVEAAIERLGVGDAVTVVGFAPPESLADALSRALCLVLPSRREGYSLVVVEAAALGTPSVVVAGDDNAAAELVEDGVNGIVAASAAPADLAAAIERVDREGPALRASTAAWFARNAERLSLAGSLDAIEAAYRG